MYMYAHMCTYVHVCMHMYMLCVYVYIGAEEGEIEL